MDFRLQREARKKELEAELAKLDLVLRHDSKLCFCYVNGQTTPEWTAPKVARECAIMHWLHTFTNYTERCRVAATEESAKNWFYSGKHFADHMKRRVYPTIKESILKENGGAPNPWPWKTSGAEADVVAKPDAE